MRTQAWGIALLRLMMGVVLVMHGYFGAVVLGPQRVAGFVTNMGFPAAVAPLLAWYLIVAHLVGGVLIILGLWTRWAALANVPVLAADVLLLHLPQGYFMRVIDGKVVGGYELPLIVLVGLLALVLTGSGAASVDRGR